MSSNKPAYMCGTPWRVLDINIDGTVKVCCKASDHFILDPNGAPYNIHDHSIDQIFYSEPMKLLRQQFRNGEKPELCATCWKVEDCGQISYRQQTAIADAMMPDEYWLSEPSGIATILLIDSNTCNLKCLMCSPTSSSRWRKEGIATNYPAAAMRRGSNTQKLLENIEVWGKNISRICLTGGEPFLIKEFNTLIRALISNGITPIQLGTVTNCTIWNDELVNLIADNFYMVDVWISLDGVGSVLEYQRFPANWETVLKNIQKYYAISTKHAHFHLSAQYALGWINVLDVRHLLTLLQTDFPNISVLTGNLIDVPKHMSLWAIPNHFKEYAANILKIDHCNLPTEMQGITNFMYSQEITDEQFMENLRVFRKHDKYRGNDLLTAVPDWAPLLKPYWDQILAEEQNNFALPIDVGK